jgi:hypothetical protein
MNALKIYKMIAGFDISPDELKNQLDIFEMAIKDEQRSVVQVAQNRQKNSNAMAIGYMEEFARRGLVYVPKVEGVDVRAQMLKMAAEIVAMYGPVDVPAESFEDSSEDVQDAWIRYARATNPDAGPKCALRFAKTAFFEREGVLPDGF